MRPTPRIELPRSEKTALRDASLHDLVEELKERGWRVIPTETMAMLVSGATTGYWPAIKDGSDDNVG